MPYSIVYSNTAEKQIAKLPKKIRTRFDDLIKVLEQTPKPPAATKLVNSSLYRIRLGEFRVIYSFSDNKLVIYIVQIEHRSTVYRNLSVIETQDIRRFTQIYGDLED